MAEVGNANVRITADDSQARSTVSGFMGSLKRIGSIATGVMGGLALFETAKNTFGGLWNATIGANSGMETYRNTLATVLKSWEKADASLAWVEKFAAQTPFEIPELVEATTRLETYGITAQDTLGNIGDMASVMGKPLMQAVEAVADAQTGELERLKEFGITKQMLIDKAAAMGKGEVVNAKGQITDQKALNEALFAIMEERYAGGMKLQSQTFQGLISNAKDSMSQIAREVSRPVFDKLKSGLAGIVPVMGALTSYVKGDFTGALDQMNEAVGPDLANRIWTVVDVVQSLFYETKEMFMNLAPSVQNLKNIFVNIAPLLAVIGVGIEKAFYKLTDIIPPIVNGFTSLIAKFTAWEGFIPVVVGLGAAIITFRTIVTVTAAAQAAFAAVTKAVTLAMNIQRAAMLVYMATGGGLRGVLAALTVVQRALNLTFLANPIALVIAALVGLGVALVVAYNKSTTFRNIVNQAWSSLKAGFQATINWFTTTLPAWVASVGNWFVNLKNSVVGKVSELTGAAVAKWNSFKAQSSAVISSFVAAALAIWNSFKSRTASVISTLVTGAVNLFNSLKARVLAIIQPFITFFINSFENLKLMVLSIVTGLASLLVGDFEGMRLALIGIITALKNQAINLWTLLKDTIGRLALAIWNNAVNNFNQMKSAVINTVRSLYTGAVNLFNNLVSSGVRAWNSLKTGAVNSARALYNGSIQTFRNLVSGALNLWNSLKNGAINAVRNLYNGAINLFNRLRSGATSAANNTKTGIVNAFENAKTWAINKVRDLYNGAVNWLLRVPGKVTEMKNTMVSTLRGINLYQMGKDAIQGFINGIGGMISSVRTKAGNVVEALKEKLAEKLKLGSPSRLMKQYGNWTFEGFINGADDMIGGIRKVAGKAAEAIQPNIDIDSPRVPVMSSLRNLGSSLMNNLVGNAGETSNGNPYVLQVVLNSRVIAEETYEDIKDLQNRAEARNRRARGEVI